MSDFDDVVGMSEETTEPVAEETPVEEPVQEQKAVWEEYGFSSEDEMKKKLSGLTSWEKELNRRSSELGAMAKQAPPQATQTESDDLFENLDPASAKQLKAAIQREAQRVVMETVGPQAEVAEELFNASAEQLFKATAENAGVDVNELYTFMSEHNLFPVKPSIDQLAKQLDFATAAYKGQNLETEVNKRVAEEVAKLKKEGAEVTAVTPSNKKAPDSEDKDDVTKLGFAEMLKNVATGKW